MNVRITWWNSILVNGQAVAHYRSLAAAIRIANDIQRMRPDAVCLVLRTCPSL